MLHLLSYLAVHCYYLLLYITNANSFPRPLTAKEETDCFLRMQKGETAAKNMLIEHNLRLVAHIIKKYYSASKDQDDLISIGTMGLIKAINTFNPDKGARLATYAARCIENEVLMYFRNVKKLSAELYLSDPIDCDKDGNSLALIDILSCEENIDDIVDLKIQTQKLYKFIKSALTERERRIVAMRYGLFCSHPLTQREVAKQLGISRSYVSRIEKKAIMKLEKEFLKE